MMFSLRESRDVGRMIEHFQAEFAASSTWAEFCAATKHEAYLAYSWAKAGFDTMKANPYIRSGHPLAMPEAMAFSDLFESARLLPVYTGERGKHGNEECHDYAARGYVLISDRDHKPKMSESVAPAGRINPVERYVRAFADGTAVGGTRNASFHMTYAKPRPDVAAALKARWSGWEGFSSFEAIRWASGAILLVGRGDKWIGKFWFAVLKPGETLRDMMPADDIAMIAKNEADADAAWACIETREDGRRYLNRARCTVRVDEGRGLY